MGIKEGILVQRHRFRVEVRTEGGILGRREWKAGDPLVVIEVVRGWLRSAGSWLRRVLCLLDKRGC